jgi:hypothetical protein
MSTTAQTDTCTTDTIIGTSRRRLWPACMWMIIALFIAGAALMIGSRLRIPSAVNPDDLGWMSAQWLAEYRASQRI